ncbi:TetR/AcrR family transcriptional regulator [Nocardia sp. NPDC001965]
MDTRERILRAAAVVFGRYGFRQSNMELIAQETGLSRQGLYRYFTSKETLFAAVVDDLHRRALEAGEAAAAAASRAGKGVDEIVFAQLDARFGVFMDRLGESLHAAELTEENALLAADASRQYGRLLVESVGRVIRTAAAVDNMIFSPDLPPDRLAYLIIYAARGLKVARPASDRAAFGVDLRQLVKLMMAGALEAGNEASNRRAL